MPAAEADIPTEHAADYLTRLCDHIGKIGQADHRLPHRRAAHGRGGPPEIRHVERGETEATVTLNWGQWVIHARAGLLAVRAEAADEENLGRIQDLLTTRLEKFGRREHLTVTWRTATAEARTTARQEDLHAERGRPPAPVPADRRDPREDQPSPARKSPRSPRTWTPRRAARSSGGTARRRSTWPAR